MLARLPYDLYGAHRHLPTDKPTWRRSAERDVREAAPSRAPTSIPCLTHLPDFSTVGFVPRRRQSWALLLGLPLLIGCGPITYMKETSPRTAAALNQAKAEQADQLAPYEYTKASLYYDKAREDAGRAYYQNAVDWGRRSQDCSRRASALARAAQTQPTYESQRPNQTCGEL